MVQRKGTKSGVATNQTIRTTRRSDDQASSIHIVTSKGSVDLSLHKDKRWEILTPLDITSSTEPSVSDKQKARVAKNRMLKKQESEQSLIKKKIIRREIDKKKKQLEAEQKLKDHFKHEEEKDENVYEVNRNGDYLTPAKYFGYNKRIPVASTVDKSVVDTLVACYADPADRLLVNIQVGLDKRTETRLNPNDGWNSCSYYDQRERRRTQAQRKDWTVLERSIQ
jgi:hypothetical protein